MPLIMNKKILGVSRSPRFSPNSTHRDEAIFSGVIAELVFSGLTVDRVCEDDFVTAEGYDAVFSMARDERVLAQLSSAEEKGLCVINSATALLRNTRVALTESFERAGIPVPYSPYIFDAEGRHEGPSLKLGKTADRSAELTYPFWLKRSGACAQSAGDVCFVETPAALDEALKGYAERGVGEVLASEHLAGDLVKFYGVEGTDFFYYHYPTADNAFSKFGLEKINGAPSGYPLDTVALKQCADKAAALSGIVVYGGDCIVDADGHFRIIDFNDWPSYSRCCEAAARAIAEKIRQQL